MNSPSNGKSDQKQDHTYANCRLVLKDKDIQSTEPANDMNLNFTRWFYGSLKKFKTKYKKDSQTSVNQRKTYQRKGTEHPQLSNSESNSIVSHDGIPDHDRIELLTQNLDDEIQPVEEIVTYSLTVEEKNPKKRLSESDGSPDKNSESSPKKHKPMLKDYIFVINTNSTIVDRRKLIDRRIKGPNDSELSKGKSSIIEPDEDYYDSEDEQVHEIIEIDCDL